MTAGDDQANRWKATERNLREALSATNLSETGVLQIEEYLDHNELGLAFEVLVLELDERESGVASATLSHLRSALVRMGPSSFDTDCLDAWERVQRRTTP